MTPPPAPRRFALVRDVDVSGVSGTGAVADGVLWPDGTVSIRWRGDHPSTVNWTTLADAEHVNGHGGLTRLEWIDHDPARPFMGPWSSAPNCDRCHDVGRYRESDSAGQLITDAHCGCKTGRRPRDDEVLYVHDLDGVAGLVHVTQLAVIHLTSQPAADAAGPDTSGAPHAPAPHPHGE